MRLAVLSFQGPDYHPNRRLGQAAAARGWEMTLWHPYRVRCGLDGGLELDGAPAAAPQAALPRVGAEISDHSLALVRHLEFMGAAVVNGSAAVATARHKFQSLQALAAAGLPVPPTWQVNNPESLAAAAERLGGWPLVVKDPGGRQGSGVVLAHRPEAAQGLMEAAGRRAGILAQRYLPVEGRRDFRVLVVDGRAAAAVEAFPPPGDFRANVHLGASLRPLDPPAGLSEMAVAAARALGLTVAGVDLILDASGRTWLIEVNYSPGFRGLESATGLDVAGLILEAAARMVKRIT